MHWSNYNLLVNIPLLSYVFLSKYNFLKVFRFIPEVTL